MALYPQPSGAQAALAASMPLNNERNRTESVFLAQRAHGGQRIHGDRVTAVARVHDNRCVGDTLGQGGAAGSAFAAGKLVQVRGRGAGQGGKLVAAIVGAKLAQDGQQARIGLASGFGMINYDRGLSSGAVILWGETQ